MTVTMERNTNTQLTGVGARFKTSREALRFSEKDVAARLHLNPNIISIIENERFENGPPMIFMRGYLRSYARLLSISDEEINIALSQLDMINPTTSVTTNRSMQAQPISYKLTRWMTYSIVLLLITLVAMWWRNTHINNSSIPKTNEIPAETISQSTTTSGPVIALSNAVQAISSPNIAPSIATTNTALSQQPVAPTTTQPSAKAPQAIQISPETPQPVTPAATVNTPRTPLPEIAPTTTEAKPKTTITPPATIPAEASAQKAQTEPETTSEPDLTEAKMEVPEPGLEPDSDDAPNTQIPEENN